MSTSVRSQSSSIIVNHAYPPIECMFWLFVVHISMSKLTGYTWGENYAGSSGLPSAGLSAERKTTKEQQGVKVGVE